MTVPRIDPRVRHVGVSFVRRLNATALRSLDGLLVVEGADGESPLAVVMSYELFLQIQAERDRLSALADAATPRP